MKLREVAEDLERAARALPGEAGQGLEETRDHALKMARIYSSGRLTPRDLRKKDFPYARRHGNPLSDPGIINAQSGTFRDSWTADPLRDEGGALHAGLFNADPKAGYLEQLDGGPNSKMFRRPIDDRIASATEPVFDGLMAQALKRAIGG